MTPRALLDWIRKSSADGEVDAYLMGYIRRCVEEMAAEPEKPAPAGKGKPVFASVDEAQDIGCNLRIEFVAPRHFYLSAVLKDPAPEPGVMSVRDVYLSRETIERLARFAGVLPSTGAEAAQ